MSLFKSSDIPLKPFKDLQANEIMDKKFKVVEINSHMTDAVSLITANKISGLPVVDEGFLVGFLSEKDCLKFIMNVENYNIPESQVSEYCTKHVLSINSFMKLPEIIKIFVAKPFHIYPVEQDGKCIGIITRNYLLKLAADMKIENWKDL